MPQTDPRPVPAAAAEAQRSPIHVPLVDALRGFAALSVLVYHVIEHFKWTEFPISGPLVWFRLGFLGVDLFFAISGLVIGLSAFSLIGRTGTPGFMLPFLQRRRARIAPLHWLTCLVFATLVMPQTLLQPNLWENALAHLAFVHNLDLTLHSAINGVNGRWRSRCSSTCSCCCWRPCCCGGIGGSPSWRWCSARWPGASGHRCSS